MEVGVTRIDLRICDCECHRWKTVKHAAPCCHTCPHCKRRVRVWAFEKHEKECAAR